MNTKYALTSIEMELGQPISEDISEYINLDHMSDEDVEFVRDNIEILYDGEPINDTFFDTLGDHTLTINYCGDEYRQYSVVVSDTTSPTIESLRNIYTFIGLKPQDTAIDNAKDLFYAEDNSGEVVINIDMPDIDYEKAGTYTITATAEDPSGNTAEATADIVVQKPEYGAEGTYVFVSIANQHLTYFEDGKVVLECPVVTGNPYTNHSTPKGTYSLNYKSRNVTLKGTEDNGEPYESFVGYWMAYVGAMIGLHDATWRNSFGGEIYKGGGSHGCVNMPYDSAAKLYELIQPGTPVLVY